METQNCIKEEKQVSSFRTLEETEQLEIIAKASKFYKIDCNIAFLGGKKDGAWAAQEIVLRPKLQNNEAILKLANKISKKNKS
jgi:CobQ-like glutamine amidotransferase family enzyme